MKQTLFFLACLALLSCNSENEATRSETTASSSSNTDNVITFKAEGQMVNTAGLMISRVKLLPGKAPYLNFTTDMHREKRTVNINVNGTVPGTYTLSKDISSGSSHGIYHPDYNMAADGYFFEKGHVVLTEVDTVKNIVNGTFSGEAKNEEGRTITITDGKIINGTLTPGVTSLQ